MRIKVIIAISFSCFYFFANAGGISSQLSKGQAEIKKDSVSYCGFYIGEEYSDYVIISRSGDNLFFDHHFLWNDYFNYSLKMADSGLSYTMGGNEIKLKFSNGSRTLSIPDGEYSRVTLGDSILKHADSLFFFVGLGYLNSGKAATDTGRKIMLLRCSLPYFKESLKLRGSAEHPYINYGVAYYYLQAPDSAKLMWDKGKQLSPKDPLWPTYYNGLVTLYLNKGLELGRIQKYNRAIYYFQKGLEIDPKNADLWYNIGGAYYTVGNYSEAKKAWKKALKINPDYTDARRGLDALKEKK